MERGQLVHGGDHLRGGDLVEDVRLGPSALIAQLLVEHELAEVVQADVVLPRALEAVPEKVAHDREEPCLHVRARLVAVLITERPQISLLDQVLGRVRVVREPERAPVQGVEVCQSLIREGGLGGGFRHQ